MTTKIKDQIQGWAWRGAQAIWVAAPILGFWIGISPRIYQVGWWALASILVLAVSAFTEVRHVSRLPALFILFAIVPFSVHTSNFSLGSAWITKVALICGAAIAIGERGDWVWLLKVLKVCALIQILIIFLQWMKVDLPWQSAGGGLTGSLYKRGALSIFFGYLSIWSTRWTSYAFSMGSLLSGSLAGAIPCIARLAWNRGKSGAYLIGAGLCAMVWIALYQPYRITTRIEAWSGAEFIRNGWLTGWGFFPLPGAFREDMAGGSMLASPVMSDYHSTWLDFIARFGLIGLLAISPLVYRVLKLTFRDRADWKVWTLVMAGVAGCVQSAESFAVMSLLGLVAFIRLEQEKTYVD